MTTTTTSQPATEQTAAQVDDLQVIRTPPTAMDAQLILQQHEVDAISGANYGFGHLGAFETPPTLAQLRKKHPRDTEEYHEVMAFLSSCETTSTFVRQGLLNEALVHDLYWIAGAWARIEKIIRGMRKEAGEPRLYENSEWLARRAT
jgi:hypothetical protein